jgi:hypothetical protein
MHQRLYALAALHPATPLCWYGAFHDEIGGRVIDLERTVDTGIDNGLLAVARPHRRDRLPRRARVHIPHPRPSTTATPVIMIGKRHPRPLRPRPGDPAQTKTERERPLARMMRTTTSGWHAITRAGTALGDYGR